MGNGWNSIDIRCVEHVVTMDFIAKQKLDWAVCPMFPSAWNRGDGISMDRCTEHLRMNFPSHWKKTWKKKHGKTMGFRWGFSLPPMASPLRSSGRSTPSSMKRPVAGWTFRSHWPLPYWRRWMPAYGRMPFFGRWYKSGRTHLSMYQHYIHIYFNTI